jgi:hypothetical protein
MPRKVSTKTRLENSPYPSLQIIWTEDADQNGWTGEAVIWADGNTQQPCGNHTVTVGQGMPLGAIYVSVDGFSHGAWSFGSFEGVGLTERDLQWASLYAVEAIKRKQNFSLQS